MTVWNRQKYLRQAIESVLAQTYQDFEFIIWDDGSSDRSLEIAGSYQSNQVLVIAGDHQGQIKSQIEAHKLAQGEYLGWVDSDDYLCPTALEETAAVLDENLKIGLVYTGQMLMNSCGEAIGVNGRCNIPYSANRLLVDFISHHFRLFRHDVFKQVGGINPVETCADYDLCLRLSEITAFAQIPTPLYWYRIHPESISSTKREQQILESFLAVKRALVRRNLNSRYKLLLWNDKLVLQPISKIEVITDLVTIKQ